MGILLAVAGVIVHSRVKSSLVEDLDATLLAKASALGALFDQDKDSIDFDFRDELMPEFSRQEAPEYFQAWIEGAPLSARSRSLGRAVLERRAGDPAHPLTWNLHLPDGRAGRAAGIRLPVQFSDDAHPELTPGSSHSVAALAEKGTGSKVRAVVVVAASREEIQAHMARLDVQLILGAATMLLSVAALAAVTIRRGLRPLDDLGQAAEEVEAASLSRRLPTSQLPRELAGPGRKLNQLLERPECSFERERRVTAGLAHELRTPVAELRSATDIARRWPGDPELGRQAIATCGEVAEMMGSLISALLRLSRIESGQESLIPQQIDLGETARKAWEHACTGAGCDTRALSSNFAVEEAVLVSADQALLLLALGNIFENALSHGAEAARVSVEVKRSGACARVLTTNPAPHLAPSDLEHLAEPFWCQDDARTHGERSGLGLALVKSALRAMGAELAFSLVAGQLVVGVAFKAVQEASGPR